MSGESEESRPSDARGLFAGFPMGPKLREVLGLSDAYVGDVSPQRDAAAEGALTRFLAAHHDHYMSHLSPRAVVDLLDELVSMDLPEAALDLAQRRSEAIADDDFRAQLALGVAAMLTGDLERAEVALRAAQAALPAEPAPYVNLVQIFIELGRAGEAETWCLAGLDAEPNHLRLWDLLASLYRDRCASGLADEVRRVADRRGSWAGLSLAAELTAAGDHNLKASMLERLYSQGERDPQFLIELTGAYGAADRLDRIPPLVWQAERDTALQLPWQLHLHCAQAQLGLGQPAAALAALAKAERDGRLSAEGRAAVAELRRETTPDP